MDWKTFLFGFSGRVNRGKYWLSVLVITPILLIVAFVLGLLTDSILGRLVETDVLRGEARSPGVLRYLLGEAEGPPAMVAVFMVIATFNLWIALAVGTKRLHDRDKSGWWVVLFYLVPMLLNTIGKLSTHKYGWVLVVIGLAITVWGFIELGCLKGTRGPNSYGPDPLPRRFAA